MGKEVTLRSAQEKLLGLAHLSFKLVPRFNPEMIFMIYLWNFHWCVIFTIGNLDVDVSPPQNLLNPVFSETNSNECTKYIIMIKGPQWGNIFEIGFHGRHRHINWQLSVQNTLKLLLRLRLGSGQKKWGKKYPFSFDRCSAPEQFFCKHSNWTMVECTLNQNLEGIFSRWRPISVFYKINHYSFWKTF